MKNLIVLLTFIFSLSFSFSQRNTEDSLNLVKINEVEKMIIEKLSGTVTSEDVYELTNYLYNSSFNLQFFCLMNDDLVEMNKNPNQKVDASYLNMAFTQLKNKKNVVVELLEIWDYYDFYDSKNKKSDYMLVYKIHFTNNTSFGKNTKNFVDFKIDVINGKITTIFYNYDKV